MQVEALTNDIDFKSSLSREQFEEECDDLFARSVAPVEQVLVDTNKTAEEIHAVVIIGGASRIPKIQTMLMEVMKRDKLEKNLNGDEAAALGAPLQCHPPGPVPATCNLHRLPAGSLLRRRPHRRAGAARRELLRGDA